MASTEHDIPGSARPATRRSRGESLPRAAAVVLDLACPPANAEEVAAFAAILDGLERRFDIDPSALDAATLRRRVRRRLALAGLDKPLDYADRLAVDAEEAATLLAECLASGPSLLSDRDAFAAIMATVIAPRLARLGAERDIRVWVAGCGAGEDVYALAIAFCEAAAARGGAPGFRILATDADGSALAAAVAGRFPFDALGALEPDLVERYFEREGDSARAKADLQRHIAFHRHDLMRDPPFARIDLVCCRRALASQQREASARVLRLFRSALTPGGLLLLGPSGALGGDANGFEVLDRGARIFGRPLRASRKDPGPADDAANPTRDLEALLQAVEIGAVFLDDGLRVRRYTPAASRVFALSADDIGRGIADVALRFEGVNLLSLLVEVVAAGAMREVEIGVEGHAYLLRVLPHRGAGAAPMGAIVTVIDVNALKMARRRVRDLNRRNQTVIESLSETIVSWDPKSEHILFSNEAFAQTLELSVEDLLGRPLAAVVHPEVHRHKRDAMAALQSQPFVTSLVRTPKPSGEIVWRSVRYTAVNGFDGRLVAYLACGRDVSDEVRYVEALEALAGVQTPIDLPFETFAAQALKIGAGLLGVPYAALSQSEGEQRRVACLVGPDKAPPPALGELALARASEIARRPEGAVSELHAEAGLAACIGVVVRAGAESYGAVCFFSDEPPAFGPITDIQRGFVRHIAQWIGMKIEIHRKHLSLRRSEAELRLIFDNVAQNIWRLDGLHRVRWANAGAAQSMGLDPRSVVGAPADAFMQRLDPKWRAHGEAAFGSQTAYYGVEAQFKPRGQAPQWTSTDFAPDNEGPDGEPSLLVVSTDITLAKERETELEVAIADADHSRRLYQQHYRRTPVLLCSFQRDGRVVEASDLWRDKTGYGREEVVGRRLGDFMDEPSRLRAVEALTELWRMGACEAVPLRFVAKSGRMMEVELSGYVSAEEGGAPLCLAALVDVTARSAAETALERANRDLATVNDGLKKFAHVASHDLQEPLRKIRQFGDILISEHRQALSDDAAFCIEAMRDSSDRMRRLIKDILDFSRSINATMSRTRLPLAEIAHDILSELEMAVREAGAEVRIGRLPTLLGDRTAVQLLMRNLIGNSLKYRRPGVPPQVSISGAWASEAEFVLSFKDNGGGVDPRYHEIIFDAFTRLQTHGDADGSGLGLAICKSVCERQQWRIGVKSAPGEGAEFTLAIPAADVANDSPVGRRA